MKYYSEKTHKTYDSEEACLTAEKELEDAITAEKERKEKLSAERKARAQEVEDAYEALVEARKHYNDVIGAFVKDYGSFHMTLRNNTNKPYSWIDFWANNIF